VRPRSPRGPARLLAALIFCLVFLAFLGRLHLLLVRFWLVLCHEFACSASSLLRALVAWFCLLLVLAFAAASRFSFFEIAFGFAWCCSSVFLGLLLRFCVFAFTGFLWASSSVSISPLERLLRRCCLGFAIGLAGSSSPFFLRFHQPYWQSSPVLLALVPSVVSGLVLRICLAFFVDASWPSR
jgi:hypothetical protein